jgi:translation initiation factor IF-3
MGAGFCAHFIFTGGFIINYVQPTQRPKKQQDDLINERIPFQSVRVIGPDGDQLGIMPKSKAIQVAQTYSLDLVCVTKEANPPVCKILNYGKYRFEKQKKEKEMKKTQKAKEISIKEVQLTPVIGQHDLETKAKLANKYLVAGDKIKVVLRFRGRQLTHTEVGQEVMDRFIEACAENSVVEKKPVLDGKLLTAVLASKFKK